MIIDVLTAILVVTVIGVIAGVLLAVASHFFAVPENETKKKVRECLPGANCGACGFAGCDAYADAVANGKFMRMRRAAWTGGTKEKSPKLQRLLELTNEAYENDSKVIVFTFFRDVITTVVEALGDRVVEPIHGGVPINQRQEIIDEFRDSKTKNVLVAQINTAAHGLNIQFANTIIFCEPQIKPSLESQAVARAYRMGQVDNVFVYRLLTVNSIDELMMDMLGNKQALFDQFADRSHLQDELIGLEEKEDKDSKNIQTKIIDLEAERLNIERVSKEIETV